MVKQSGRTLPEAPRRATAYRSLSAIRKPLCPPLHQSWPASRACKVTVLSRDYVSHDIEEANLTAKKALNQLGFVHAESRHHQRRAEKFKYQFCEMGKENRKLKYQLRESDVEIKRLQRVIKQLKQKMDFHGITDKKPKPI
ncbi:unnamed protein product [Mucor fragilis]